MDKKLKFLMTCHSKWHYFNVAESLNKTDQLTKLITGYPKFKSQNYKIDNNKIISFPSYTIGDYLLSGKNYKIFNILRDKIQFYRAKKISMSAINFFDEADILLSLSGSGFWSLDKFKNMGKIYICERSSSHILYQKTILEEEYKNFGLSNNLEFDFSNWKVENELYEYENADFILTPSKFVSNSFIKKGHRNIIENKFGVNVDNFKILRKNDEKKNSFDILYVGQLSIRKGLHYLLDAFEKFKHPYKKLHIVGPKIIDYKFYLKRIKNMENIVYYGSVDKNKLLKLYNSADIFILPTLEEGYANVINEALACGCPVIVTDNSGAKEFVEENNCGFTVPIRNSKKILENLEKISENNTLLEEIKFNVTKISNKRNWEDYSRDLNNKINSKIR